MRWSEGYVSSAPGGASPKSTPTQIGSAPVTSACWKLVDVLETTTDETDMHTYRVHDRIPLGPFTLRTSYVARLHVLQAGGVVAEARQYPGYACTAP